MSDVRRLTRMASSVDRAAEQKRKIEAAKKRKEEKRKTGPL